MKEISERNNRADSDTILSPGNEGFRIIRNGIYVDKTGIINVINKTINTSDRLTCISRPRRFGKSYTAQTLCAYYGRGYDSHDLFENLEISKNSDYEKYINSFNVIYLDITGFISSAIMIDNVVSDMRKTIIDELLIKFPCAGIEQTDKLGVALLKAKSDSQIKFFFIIDEWDALFREQKKNNAIQEEYINFLRELFKNGNVTNQVIAGAFMTGILPIKKYGHQSAISDFREYTMTQPSIFAEYVGFTKKDIDQLARTYSLDRKKLKHWYDGYYFKKVGEIYNPNSVCQAIRTQEYVSYWTKTETYQALLEYIHLDKDGLQADIIQMIGGNAVKVDTSTFQNDMTSIQNRDDVLSLLIHLGYLAYNSENLTARIPNEEIREEFISTVKMGTHDATNLIIKNSDQLILDTINCDESAVAKAIENAHDVGTFGASPIFYNDEQSLRAVIKFAYISCANNYIKVEELPSGHGYADVVYIPKSGSQMPALLIELKVNDSAEGAIAQIKDRKYPKIFENSGYEVVLCGINYDIKTKKHTCKIEKMKL